jgi:hypothetical protein
MTNLYAASNQWATRPDDERFETIQEMHATCLGYAQSARTAVVSYEQLRVEADDGALYLAGKQNRAAFTHYSFGQLCRNASVPADFVRSLPATLAGQVVNHKLKATADQHTSDAKIMFHENGHLVARAITSEMYDRIWNHEVLSRAIMPMGEEGWRVPPARPSPQSKRGVRKATKADILPNQEDFGLSVKVGDPIAPAGLYASDHDMFVFLVNPERSLDIGGRSLMRGMFVRNSEVGDGALVVDWFDLDNVCGNHICWGVQNHNKIRVKHIAAKARVGRNDTLKRAIERYEIACTRYDEDLVTREKLIKKAMKFQLGADKESVVDAVFSFARARTLPALTKSRIDSAYDLALEHKDWYGPPNTLWSLVSGLTEHSQNAKYADVRHEIDTAAGKLLQIAA